MDVTGKNGNGFQFDYSPWQRTGKKVESSKPKISTSKKPVFSPSLVHKSIDSKPSHVTIARKTPSSPSHSSDAIIENCFPNLRKECSSLCRHGVRTKTPEVSLPEKRRSKDGKITLLKLLIKERRLALEAIKQRYLKFVKENKKLKEEITSFEDSNYTDVKELLTKYKKYQGALSVLNSTHAISLEDEEFELLETQKKTEKLLQVLRNDAEELDMKIESEKHALKVLHNYKEKEYPDKLEQMKRLQYEIDIAEAEFVASMSELQEIADTEKKSYIVNAKISQGGTISDLAEHTLITMDGSMKEMAKQNVLIQQEIDFHHEELKRHQIEINQLELEIRSLKEEKEESYSRKKYPEKFSEICSPDTEFELRIPQQRYLPI